MTTLNNIIKGLNNFADNHFFIKSFTFGEVEDSDLEKEGSYPLMHTVYTGATYPERSKEYSFEITLLDRPPSKEGSKQDYQREVISDLEQCAEDLLADLHSGFNIFSKDFHFDSENATITPLIEVKSNVLSGVSLDITVSVPYQHDSCNAPLTGVIPNSGDCDDATLYATATGAGPIVTVATIPSGGSFTIDKNDIIGSDDISGGEVYALRDVKIVNATIDSLVDSGTQIEVTVDTITPSGIQYKQIEHGVLDTYTLYDEGWWSINRGADMRNTIPDNAAIIAQLNNAATDPFSTLKNLNIHGNNNRFTAQDGTQNFISGGVIEDHLYYTEWINTYFANATLSAHLNAAEANTTSGGTTVKWRLASQRELMSIIDMNSTNGYPSEFPFSSSSTWTASRYRPSSTQQLYNWGGVLFSRRVPGTFAYRGCYMRRGTW